MTDEQINAAIAEACGWKSKEETDGVPWLWVRTKADYTCESSMEPLNYCGDLNAMHEAEKALTVEEWSDYVDYLPTRWEEAIHATARERAEAFLRTLGTWAEGK
jgi:hypothetical protein